MIKAILKNEYFLLTLRLLLGLTFLAASIDKIYDPSLFAKAIANYKLISGSSVLVIATILPWIELLCAMSMIFGILVRGSSLVLFSLLGGFTIAVVTGLIRGLDIACGCFTLDPEVGKIGWQKVAENVGLILTSVILFYSEVKKFTLRLS
jgi:putative oxidoreductase